MKFGEILAAWYGPDWKRIAPAALGRSRRTIGRWCAEDRVPRWVLRRFQPDRVEERWREIDRRAVVERARLHARIGAQKEAIERAALSVEDRLRRARAERAGRRSGRRGMTLHRRRA